jgi:putative FmdB family regulatory protein
MPTYGYECKKCKHTFDAFQSMKDEPLKVCPKCGKELRRLINGGGAVIFKGNGFYVTDKNGKSGSSRESSSSGDSGSKSDSKPAVTAPCSGCAKAESSSCPKAAS